MNKIAKIILIALLSYNCTATPVKKNMNNVKTDSLKKTVETHKVKLLFMGDIMGHDSQIKSAYNAKTKNYQYDSVFGKIKHIIKKADISIANLEVTLAGKPYKGYPAFSSPDQLLFACKRAGIDVLMTSNNHSCDRGKKGIVRTIKMLDSLNIKHTGTFINKQSKDKNNLLIITKNTIKLGFLNYTYGTNGLKTPSPCIVNRIDTLKISKDINLAKKQKLDKLIVMIHWGIEYSSTPSKEQIAIAKFLLNKKVDILIGSHPHVLQPMELKLNKGKKQIVVYSLGNFVSNQRTRKRDGGAMVEIEISKTNNTSQISNNFYYLTWVNKPIVNDKIKFEIIPCKQYENLQYKGIRQVSRMKIFLDDSRKLLNKNNINFPESK